MKKMKSVLAIFLAVLMLLPCLVGCGKDKTTSEGNDNDGQRTETLSIVPDDVTFEGETFTILCREDNAWGEFLHEITADEDATELVNEAVYKRNLEVEERFGLEELKAHAIPGQWNVNGDFINTFRNSVLANSGSFDLVMSQQAYMADSSLLDLYSNFYDVPYVCDNMTAEYYFPDIVEELTIDGKLLYMLSDYSLTYWEYVYVLYFNKELAENYNLENIYDLVRDGEWTWDKMVEMAKGVWVDENGDLWPGEEDTFGYVTDISNTTDAMWDLFDVRITSKDENGDIKIDVDQAKMVSILQQVIEFKKTDDTYFYQTSSEDVQSEDPGDKIFREGRALFYPSQLDRAQRFRDMETNFGIVPYPKWSENDEKYTTRSQDGYSVAIIPIDAPNLEMSGAVYDVLAAISSKNVIPAYYDMALKDKYSRDDDSGEMLDIIRDGFQTTFGSFYAPIMGRGLEFRILIGSENSNFVSYYDVNRKAYERNLRKLLEAYATLDELAE